MTEFRDRWRAVLASLLLVAVLGLVVVVPMFDAWSLESLAVQQLGLADLFLGQIILAGFLTAWFLLQQRYDWRAFLRWPRRSWRQRIARGAWLGVICWMATLTTVAVLNGVARSIEVEPHENFATIITWLATRPWWLRAALIIAAMTIEEAFFRAFLQPRIGVLASAGCFAVSHLGYGSPAMGGGVFVLGLMLARAYTAERDLAICVVAHGTFDAIQLLLVLPWIAASL